MATTFSGAYKSLLLDLLTGRGAYAVGNTVPQYYNLFSGTQPGDPTTGGTVGSTLSAWSSYSVGGQFNVPGTNMTAASLGETHLASYRTSTVGSYAGTATGTWGRLYTSGGVGIIDCVVSTAGGGGGMVFNTVALPTNTQTVVLQALSIKFPLSNGTLMWNAAVANEMIDCISGSNTPTAPAVMTSSTITFYDGTPPSSADAPLSGNNVLGSITIGATSIWAAASGGATALTGTQTITVNGTGTCTFARCVKSTFTVQFGVNTAAADMIVDTTAFVNGTNRSLTSATLTF